MSRSGWFATIALGLLALFALDAAAAPLPGSTYLSGGFQYSEKALKDFNGYTGAFDASLVEMGLPGTFGGFRGVWGLEVGVGHHFGRRLSIGLDVAHGRYSKDNLSTGPLFFGPDTALRVASLSRSQAMDLRLTEITANVTLWVPHTGGLFLGAQGGVGMASYEELQLETLVFGDSYNFSSTLQKYSGSGFVGGGFAGYQVELAPSLAIYVKGGYRLRNLGKLKGHYDPLLTGEPSSHELRYRDSGGVIRSVSFDFSGMYTTLGLSLSFGGRSH